MSASTNARILVAASSLALALLAGGMILADPFSPRQLPAETASGAAAAAPAGKPKAPEAVVTETAPPRDPTFVIKRVLPISGPIRYGDWHWDEAHVPEGPIVITVDLDARVLSIFKGGYEVGAAAVLLGSQEKPTPTGTFPITQKKRHHISNLYGAPMPYMQRLTDDGISLHGSDVELGYASHGCIGMPEPFAAKIFAQTKVGDRVFITRGKMVGVGDSLVES